MSFQKNQVLLRYVRSIIWSFAETTMQRSYTCGANVLHRQLEQLLRPQQRAFMSGKLTKAALEHLSRQDDIYLSYPPYNQNKEVGEEVLNQLQQKVAMKINTPLYTPAHHQNLSKIVKHFMFANVCKQIGIEKPFEDRIDDVVLQRVVAKDGKVSILRQFLEKHGHSETAKKIEEYQVAMQNIPSEALVNLKTLNDWQATMVNPDFANRLEYDQVLSIFGKPITVQDLQELGFLKDEKKSLPSQIEDIRNTLSWLAKSFVIYRIPGSLVDLANFVVAIYSTTSYYHLSVEDKFQMLINNHFVVPHDAWIPTVLIGDGEVDDDLVLALRLLVSTQKLHYILQIPVNLPETSLKFYQNLDPEDVDLTIFKDPDSTNGPKMEAKGY
jgi:hypothetical protein